MSSGCWQCKFAWNIAQLYLIHMLQHPPGRVHQPINCRQTANGCTRSSTTGFGSLPARRAHTTCRKPPAASGEMRRVSGLAALGALAFRVLERQCSVLQSGFDSRYWLVWHRCNTLPKIVVGTHRFTDRALLL